MINQTGSRCELTQKLRMESDQSVDRIKLLSVYISSSSNVSLLDGPGNAEATDPVDQFQSPRLERSVQSTTIGLPDMLLQYMPSHVTWTSKTGFDY
jgi:hypothetical protein